MAVAEQRAPAAARAGGIVRVGVLVPAAACPSGLSDVLLDDSEDDIKPSTSTLLRHSQYLLDKRCSKNPSISSQRSCNASPSAMTQVWWWVFTSR